MSDPIRPRALAAEAVGEVLRAGGYSNVVVAAATRDLASPDASRVRALVFGALRRLEHLDAAIAAGAGRPIDEIDPGVADRLRISAFEVMYGELPTQIAVSAGVDLVRSAFPKAAGFANAVLRRVSEAEPAPEEGIVLSPWLMASLTTAWGEDETRDFSLASATEPRRVVRGPAGRPELGEPLDGIPGAYAVAPGPLPAGTAAQDGASIAVGNAVSADTGMTVADLAAAPGGKTRHLLDQVGESGLVVAVDSHPGRVARARKRVPTARWALGDARFPPLRPGAFDRVLLDAPCSGLGTLRRRPEIRFRVTPEEVHRLAEGQREMLAAARGLVAPGGMLVYSVCTVTPEETVEVIDGDGFEPPNLPGRVWGDGRLLGPHLTGTDGMFVAVWRA